jgi:uncharacterized protein YdeI (YjbR/CyaY-like superfamily)
MGKKDKRIDAYIAKAQPFAKPILKHLRELVHRSNPDIDETIKWSMPHFDYKGKSIFGMASFKMHASFGFWRAGNLPDPDKILNSKEAMGHLGRITSLKDLPPDKIMIKYLKAAAKLVDGGVKPPKKQPKPKTQLVIPEYFIKTISKSKKALRTFENFSYSHKKEYVEWVTEAKTEETRKARLTKAIEWMSENKVRNWKYIKK